MGLNIRLYGINSPKAFTLSYKIGKTAGNESVIATGYTSYGSLYPASSSRNYTNDPIIFPDASFDTQYWFKLTYTGDTGDVNYYIENIFTNEAEVYDNCINCCYFPNVGTASFVHPPTATPAATPIPTPSATPGATPIPTPSATPGATPGPTPTSTVVPCNLTISSTITTAPTNQAGTNGTSVITFTTTNGPSTYTLNGVSKGACTSPLTIPNLSSSVEYTVVITDSNSCTAQSVFTLGQTTFTFSADYIMITYEFIDGTDLDTRTRIVSPFVGQDTQNEYLGWNCQSRWPLTGTQYLTWSGDNTGTGFESVLVDLNQFNIQNPSTTQILMDMRGFWFGSIGTQLVNVAATLWKGGTPVQNGCPRIIYDGDGNVVSSTPYCWTNSTATSTFNIDSVGKQVTSQGAPVKGTSSGERIATLSYNLVTGVGFLDNNDTTTATV